MNTICVQTTKHWRYYLTSKMLFRCNITLPHNKTFIKNAIYQITFWWILYCLNSCCSWFFCYDMTLDDGPQTKLFFYFRFHKFSTNQKCNCRSEELFIAYLESTTQSLAICYFRNIFLLFSNIFTFNIATATVAKKNWLAFVRAYILYHIPLLLGLQMC